MIYQFNGDQNTDLSAFPQLVGKTILSISYSRWRNAEGIDKGGRIDVEVDDSPPPILYVTDLFVSTPEIKDDPLEALQEAVTEMEKGKGNKKSIALIALSQAKYLKHLERQVDKLEKKLEKMDAEIEKLKKKA